MKRATETFACHAGMVHYGTEYPDDHPLVQEFPGLFEASETEPTPKRRGRPPGTKNRPKGDTDA